MFDKIVEIISETTDIPQDKVKLESRFLEDLQLDSLSFIELIVKLEKTFGVSIHPDDVEHIQTVGEVIQWLKKSA